MGTDFLLLLERDVDTSGLEPGHNKTNDMFVYFLTPEIRTPH